ncbi:MAG: hypothetical protein JWO95_1685, partial [Verrucomicrobiales bacterium]|nr:hypothetical protein [Verrucomicrobiales bacterium]
MFNVQLCRWAAIVAACFVVTSTIHASPSATLDNTFVIGSGAGFPSDGSSWPQVTALAVQSDGKVIAGGQAYFTNFNGTPIHFVCRINVDGSLDSTFLTNVGTGPAGQGFTISKVVVQPDGHILVGGTFTTWNGTSRTALVRLNSDGTLDTSFMSGGGPSGVFAPNVAAIALQPDGKILIGGFFYSFAGHAVPSLVRMNADGSYDPSFVVPAQNIGVAAIGVQSDGKIFVGGAFSAWAGFSTPGIVRLMPDGTLDAAFAPTHTIPFPSLSSLYAPGDGSVYIGGFVEGTSVTTTRYFAHLYSNGSMDALAPSTVGWVGDIQPYPTGGLLVSGRFRDVSGLSRGEFFYIDSNGNVDPAFAPPPYTDITGDLVHIYTVATAPDGKIVFGGWFTNYPNQTQLNGQDYSGIGRMIGGYVGGAGSIQFRTRSNSVVENAGVATIAVNRFGGITGAVTVNYSTTAGSATAGADYTTTNGQLSWIDGEGGTKTFTVPIINDGVSEPSESFTVSLSSPTGGAVVGLPSTTTVTIVDVNSAPSITSQPQSATVNLSYPVTFTVAAGSGLPLNYQWLSNNVAIAGATQSFLKLTNVQVSYSASYSVVATNSVGATTSSPAILTVKIPSGLLDPTFIPPGSGTSQGFNFDVYAVAFQSNGLVAAGSFSQFGGVAVPNITRLNFDGSRDTNFPAAPSGANSQIQCLAQYPDGRWLIGGAFSQYAGTNRSKVARLNPNGSLDTNFVPSAVSASIVGAVLPQPDGSAYIGENNFVRKFQTNGAYDTNFISATMSGQVYALAQQ